MHSLIKVLLFLDTNMAVAAAAAAVVATNKKALPCSQSFVLNHIKGEDEDDKGHFKKS